VKDFDSKNGEIIEMGNGLGYDFVFMFQIYACYKTFSRRRKYERPSSN